MLPSVCMFNNIATHSPVASTAASRNIAALVASRHTQNKSMAPVGILRDGNGKSMEITHK